MHSACHWDGADLVLQLRVQPRATADQIVGMQDGYIKVRITAPPVEGRANAHLLRFLAEAFDVPRSHVTLESGEGQHIKRIRIVAPRAFPDAIPAPLMP